MSLQKLLKCRNIGFGYRGYAEKERVCWFIFCFVFCAKGQIQLAEGVHSGRSVRSSFNSSFSLSRLFFTVCSIKDSVSVFHVSHISRKFPCGLQLEIETCSW